MIICCLVSVSSTLQCYRNCFFLGHPAPMYIIILATCISIQCSYRQRKRFFLLFPTIQYHTASTIAPTPSDDAG